MRLAGPGCAYDMLDEKDQFASQPRATLFGTVSRVIVHPEGAWAEVLLHGAGHFYRAIRVPNVLETEDGHTCHFKTGDRVTVTVSIRESTAFKTT
jgi:hypothetical protein